MPQFTDWKSLNSAGDIADTPGAVFNYKYALFLYAAFSHEGVQAAGALVAATGGIVLPMMGISSKTIQQEWTMQILRGEGQIETVAFDHKVHIEYDIVALEVGGVGGTSLTLFTWAINDNKTNIEVTVPDPPPQIIGSPNGISLPGGGGDFTSNYTTILVDWQSPVFEFRLQKADRIRIPFHNAGGPYLHKNANVQTRTFAVSNLHSLRDERIGLTLLFYDDNAGVRCARTRQRETFLTGDLAPSQALAIAGTPKYYQGLKYEANTYCIADLGALFRIAFSRDEGLSWEVEVAIAPNVEILKTCLDENDGGAMYCLGRATATEIDNTKPESEQLNQGDSVGMVISRNAGAGEAGAGEAWVVSSRFKLKGAPLPLDDLIQLTLHDGTFTLTARPNDDLEMYESTDRLKTWRKLETI